MKIKQLIERFKGPLSIIAIIIFANILFLTGTFKSNPIDSFSGEVTFTHVGLYGVYNTIDPNNAYSTQALGHAAAEQILHGHMPWWNYNEQVGAPLAGDMQPAALFLPFNLLLEFSGGVLFFHILLEIIAGVSTYYLLKRLSCSSIVAVVGGSLFALNGTFAWFGSANINPIAFLPMFILGIEIALDKAKKSKKGGWVLIALAIAWSLYAGFPEAAYLDGLLAGVWFLVRAIQNRDKEWRKFTLKVLMGTFVGLLLAVPILIAFFDYLPYANIGGHSGTLSKYSLPASTLPALFMPYIYGPIFQFVSYGHTGNLIQFWDNIGGYLTLSVLYLAVVGVIQHPRKLRPLVYTLAIVSIIVVARNYGFPGLAQIMNLIPAMKEVALYRYVNPVLELSITILAMIGLEELIHPKRLVSKRKIVIVGLAMALLVVALLPWAIGIDHNLYLAPHHRLWLALSVAWSLGSVAAIMTSALFLKKYTKVLLPLIILVDVLVMFMAPQLSSPRSTITDTKPVTFLQQNLGNSRFYSMGYIMPNYGSYYGIASINTNNLPIPKNWSNYIPKHLNSNVDPAQEFTGIDRLSPTGMSPEQAFLMNMPAYEEVGVKYVVIRNGLLTPTQTQTNNLKTAYADNYFSIYKLPNPKPYFEVLNGKCSVASDRREAVTLNCLSPSTIERRELYIKGWTEKANGKTIPITKSGSLFEAFKVTAGKQKVAFNYTPPYIVIGYVAFALGTGLIIYSVSRKPAAKPKAKTRTKGS